MKYIFPRKAGRANLVKMLFVDTSAKLANVFVTEDGKLLSAGFDSGEKTHASMLLPVIDRALGDAGLKLEETDVIGVTNGPGSYTGLRIAIACAKMLAYGAKKPLVTVNTLDFLAGSAARKEDGDVLALLDARNTLCFYGLYSAQNGVLKSITGVRSDYTEDIIKLILSRENSGKRLILCGDGAVKNREALESGLSNVYFPEANVITGTPEGAWRCVKEKMDVSQDANDFLPEKAAADYFKEVHITLRSAEK